MSGVFNRNDFALLSDWQNGHNVFKENGIGDDRISSQCMINESEHRNNRCQSTDYGRRWFEWLQQHDRMNQHRLSDMPHEMQSVEMVAECLQRMNVDCETKWTGDMIESLFTAMPELETLHTLDVQVDPVLSFPREIANELNELEMVVEQQLEGLMRVSDPVALFNLASASVLFDGIEHLRTVEEFTQLWNDNQLNVEKPKHLIDLDGGSITSVRNKMSFYDQLFGKQ